MKIEKRKSYPDYPRTGKYSVSIDGRFYSSISEASKTRLIRAANTHPQLKDHYYSIARECEIWDIGSSDNYFYQTYRGKRWIDKSHGLSRVNAITLWQNKNKVGRVIHRDLSAVVKEMIVRQVGLHDPSL